MSPATAARLLACAAVLVSPTGIAQPQMHLEMLGPGGELYTLSVPDGYSPARPAPLVVSLHFGGPVSPHYGRLLLESVVEPALRPLGAPMVAPDCNAPAWVAPECESFVLDEFEYQGLALRRGPCGGIAVRCHHQGPERAQRGFDHGLQEKTAIVRCYGPAEVQRDDERRGPRRRVAVGHGERVQLLPRAQRFEMYLRLRYAGRAHEYGRASEEQRRSGRRQLFLLIS